MQMRKEKLGSQPAGLAQFARWEFLNVETFRKSGQGVRTPVWFVEHQGRLYVRTGVDSGKVKRIRRNPQVRLAPCDARGRLLGEWVSGCARLLDDNKESEMVRRINRLVHEKYGLQKKMFDMMTHLRKLQYATLEIELERQEQI
jgi:hypothetical protein